MTNQYLTPFNKIKISAVEQPIVSVLNIPGALDDWKATIAGKASISSLGNRTTLGNSAISTLTSQFERRITELKNPPSPGSLPSLSNEKSIEERLFAATSSVKILTSQVAMHLEREWREKLFRQIDSLHDVDEWEPDDLPVQQSSFATFLKAVCQIQPQRRPGLGLSSSGHLIATWATGKDHLTIEFLPKDRVRWVLTRNYEDGPERVAAEASVSRLYDGLKSYHPEHWFSYEEN